MGYRRVMPRKKCSDDWTSCLKARQNFLKDKTNLQTPETREKIEFKIFVESRGDCNLL